jgi:NitT/TauT family transport system substrate-binding protein
VWKRTDDVMPRHQIGCLLFGPQFIASQPAAAQGFVTAFLHSIRDFDDAFIKNDPKARAEVVSILTEATSLKDPALYNEMVFYVLPPDGQQDLNSLKVDQDFFIAEGQQPQAIDLTQLVDAHFAEKAVQVLGPYQLP